MTNTEQRVKLNQIQIPHILTVHSGENCVKTDPDFWQELDEHQTECAPVLRDFDDDFLMMFTSGTTGLAKSVPVPLRAILAFKGYMTHAVDLRDEDSFWNHADPGWAYGLALIKLIL